MNKAIGTIFAALALAVTVPASADPFARTVITINHGYGHQPLAGLSEINMRQADQRARIENGFNRGAITRFEFRRLVAEQGEIQRIEHAYVADGFLAPNERMDLHRRLDIAQSHIRFEMRRRF